MQKKEVLTKKTKKNNFRQLRKFIRAEFGADDGSFRPKRSVKKGLSMIKKENLENEYINNKDIKL